MRLLEPSLLVAVRIGETAADVTEELRREQRVGDAGTVDCDQLARGATAALMNELRDDFFADAALAGDEHFRVGERGAIDFFAHAPGGIAVAD